MRRSLPFIVGVFAFTALAWLCVSSTAPAIQADVTQRTVNALARGGYAGLQVAAEGRDVIVLGTVADTATLRDVERAARSVRGVGDVDLRLRVAAQVPRGPTRPPTPAGDADAGPTTADATTSSADAAGPVRPLEASVERFSDGTLRLTGTAPGRAARSAWVAAAARQFGGHKITLSLVTDPRQAEVMALVMPVVIRGLGGIEEGQAHVTERSVVFRGVADNLQRRAQILGQLRRLVPGDYEVDVMLRLPGEAPPPGWRRDPARAAPTADVGPVSDSGQALHADTVSAPAPEPKAPPRRATSNDDSGTGTITPPDTRNTPPAKDLSTTPPKKVDAASGAGGESAELRACRKEVRAALASNPLSFDGANLDVEGKVAIQALARALRGCSGDIVATVEAFVADQGDPADNWQISRYRSRNVKKLLVRMGVGSDRVRWEGYGQARPIASGDSAEARAKNTRVEIVLRQGDEP